jgi:DNA-binding NarL/FixJ family response regulator
LDVVLAAVRSAGAGEVLFDVEALAQATESVEQLRPADRDARDRLGRLTEREREVLRLLTEGQDGAEIPATLFLSPLTVQTHVRNVLGKLEVRSRAEAVALALRHGI